MQGERTLVPFFVVAASPGPSPGRVRVWATPFPSREAATAYARRLPEPWRVIEAADLPQLIADVRAEHSPR